MDVAASKVGMEGSPPQEVPFREAFRFWLKLGCINFGGPAGQISTMHRELVDRRRWIGERRFFHALNYCMLLPGPEATQLAIYIGWLLHGVLGGIVAGVFFVLPSVFLLIGLSALYVTYGDLSTVMDLFYGMKAAVVAVVAFAVHRIARRAIRDTVSVVLTLGAFSAMLLHVPFPVIILVAGLAGFAFLQGLGTGHGPKQDGDYDPNSYVLRDDAPPLPHTRPQVRRWLLQLGIGLVLWSVPMLALLAWQGAEGEHVRMAWFFTLAALITFGGAYAVLPMIAHYSVEVFGWLEKGQMIDGLALGETTPGPLIMIVAFVGFVGGWQTAEMGWFGAILGGVIAAYFTFLPSFLFILLGAPFIEKTRGGLRLNAALAGITAAVVGVVLHLAVSLADQVFFNVEDRSLDWLAIAITGLGLVALLRFGIVWVTLGCGLAGLLLRGWLT